MPSLRVVHRSGHGVGVYRLAVSDWKQGDLIPLGEGSLCVLEVEWHDEDDETAGTLTVRSRSASGAQEGS